MHKSQHTKLKPATALDLPLKTRGGTGVNGGHVENVCFYNNRLKQ